MAAVLLHRTSPETPAFLLLFGSSPLAMGEIESRGAAHIAFGVLFCFVLI